MNYCNPCNPVNITGFSLQILQKTPCRVPAIPCKYLLCICSKLLLTQTSCKTCPAGTHRSAVSNDDGKPWNGGNSGNGDENVANELGDCLVCESGKYQTETTKTECISCPVGTVRIGDNNDNTAMSGSKNTVADETIDCIVCESGTYQDENEKNKDMRSKLHFYKMEYETLNNNLKRDLQFNVLDCVKPSGIPRMGKES